MKRNKPSFLGYAAALFTMLVLIALTYWTLSDASPDGDNPARNEGIEYNFVPPPGAGEDNDARIRYHFRDLKIVPPIIPVKFIEYLHNRFVRKPSAYFAQWEWVSVKAQPAHHKWRWRGKDFPRVPCVLEFESYVKKYELRSEKLLTASQDPEIELIPHEAVHVISYDPDTEENDLHTLALPRTDFDFVMLSQTLEHLYDPLLCLLNFYAHMAPGGYLFASVPTFNVPHSTPVHFQHYFPDGLALLMYRAGFEIIEIGYWGNRDYAGMMVGGRKWPGVESMKKPVVNDRGFPVVTWCLVRKPQSGLPYFETHPPAKLMESEY